MGSVSKSEVMSFSVFKMEPECLSYNVRVTAEYEADRPEYLEQLHVIKGVLQAHIENSEKANLQARINQYREIREKIAAEREAKDANNRPEGGEPESGEPTLDDGDPNPEGED